MTKTGFALLSIFLFACSENKEKTADTSTTNKKTYSADGKTVKVYTTADTANYRLRLTDSTGHFADFGQPKETQICVFVDPDKQYQSYMGVGAALTDASAEVFARLPKAKQDEF